MGGGSKLGWVEHQAHPPPLDIVRVTSSIWKTPPLLDIHKHPPLGHCPCDVIHIFQGWNKIAKGWNKIAERWNKIVKGWNKIAERWNKIVKGWNKIAKGWNKIFGMGNWGGVVRPPRPPLATGLNLVAKVAYATGPALSRAPRSYALGGVSFLLFVEDPFFCLSNFFPGPRPLYMLYRPRTSLIRHWSPPRHTKYNTTYQILDLFGLSKFKEGMPPLPPPPLRWKYPWQLGVIYGDRVGDRAP